MSLPPSNPTPPHLPLLAHRRWPGLILLAGVALAAAAAVGGPWLDSTLRGGNPEELRRLELVIAGGKVDVRIWIAYGQALVNARRHQHAAAAYAHALDLEPFNREARFGRAQSLAAAGDREPLLDFLRELVLSDAKLTVDILEKRELTPFMSDLRFASLLQEARHQAMD